MSTRQSILEVIDDIDYTTNDVGFEVINEMVITNLKLINSLENCDSYDDVIFTESKTDKKSDNIINKIISFIDSLIKSLVNFCKSAINKLFKNKTKHGDVNKNILSFFTEIFKKDEKEFSRIFSDKGFSISRVKNNLLSSTKERIFIIKKKISGRDKTIASINESEESVKVTYFCNTSRYIKILEDCIDIMNHYKNKMMFSMRIDMSRIKDIEKEIDSIINNDDETTETLDQIKTDINRMDALISKIEDIHSETIDDSFKKEEEHRFRQRIGDYKKAKSLESSSDYSKWSKEINEFSKYIQKFTKWIHDTVHEIVEFVDDVLTYNHEDISSFSTTNSSELHSYTKYDYNDIKISNNKVASIIKKHIKIETIPDPYDTNHSIETLFLPKNIFGKKQDEYNQCIEKLSRCKYNMLSAANVHNWNDYEKFQKDMFEMLGKSDYQTYKLYVDDTIKLSVSKLLLDAGFFIRYYNDKQIIPINKDIRAFHFSTNDSMTQLNPTHKDKVDFYIYSSFRVFFVLVDMKHVTSEQFEHFSRYYGNNIYEYKPTRSDKFYFDTSVLKSKGDTIDHSIFTPVFMQTKTPVKIKKVELDDIINDTKNNKPETKSDENEMFSKLRHVENGTSKIDNLYMTDLINRTIAAGNKVYIATDWHLFKYNKTKKKDQKTSNFDLIMNSVKVTVKPNDLLIFLGDLTDGEVHNENIVQKTIRSHLDYIKNKVLIRGNNDLYDDEFYKQCGFNKILYSFTYKNILFSHVPQNTDSEINIHGHLHNKRLYWVPYKNHIDAASYGARVKPIELSELIKHIPEYAKKIREDSSHFNEGYQLSLSELALFINPFDE